MIRGVGASRNGMVFEQSRLDMIANNVSNVNTGGFKRSVGVGAEFGQLLLRRWGDAEREAPSIGQVGEGAVLREVTADDTPGPLEVTGRPLDLALEGPGEFTYLTAAGQTGYTRNGSFSRDSQGLLVTAEGYPVLVGGAPVGMGAGELSISPDGLVLVDGQAVGRPDIRGAGLTRIKSGALEQSNVDLAQEMTDLITALRSFQANQRVLKAQDETLARAVSDIGRL